MISRETKTIGTSRTNASVNIVIRKYINGLYFDITEDRKLLISPCSSKQVLKVCYIYSIPILLLVKTSD